MWYHGDILVIIFVILWSSYVWYWAMSGNASWQLPGSRLSLLCHCALLQHYHHHHHHHQKWKLRYQQANAELSISYISQRRGSLNQSGLGYDLFHSKHLDVSWLFTFTYAVTKLSETANKLSPRCQHPSSININVFITRYFGLPANRWFSKLSRVGYEKKYRIAGRVQVSVGCWMALPKVRQYLTARVKQLKSPKQEAMSEWVTRENRDQTALLIPTMWSSPEMKK